MPSSSLTIGVLAGGLGVGLALALLRRARRPPKGVLWANPITTCSRRVIAACVEAGVDFDLVSLDFQKLEHKQPEYMKLQPYGKVPAWQDETGVNIFESRALMNYVAGGSSLVPTDAAARAVMDQWISVEYSFFHPAFLPIFYMRVINKMPLDEKLCAAKRLELEATLDTMEARLQCSGYLAGDAFTLADLTYMCYFEVFAPTGVADTLDTRPALAAWWAKCRARPAWQYTISGKVVEDRKPRVDPLGRY